MVRHAELKEQLESLPQGSAKRKTLEKRISRLEQYRLPKEDERDAEQREDVVDESGKKIGERHSVGKRMIERRRGRPEEFTIKNPCSIRREISSSGKGLAGDCGTIRTQRSLGIAASGTALERGAEK
jgi:hypothetical protein